MSNPSRNRSCQLETLETRNLLSRAGVHQPAEVVPAATVVSPPAVVGSVEGSVVEGWNNQGVSGVRVQLLNASSRVVLQTWTDAQGRYDFANVPLGGYVVREAAQHGAIKGLSIHGGALVGVGDDDPAMLGPNSGDGIYYTSSQTTLFVNVDPNLGFEPTKADISAVRRDEARIYAAPLTSFETQGIIDGAIRGGGLGLALIGKIL